MRGNLQAFHSTSSGTWLRLLFRHQYFPAEEEPRLPWDLSQLGVLELIKKKKSHSSPSPDSGVVWKTDLSTQMFFLLSHPFTMLSRSIKQTKRERSAHDEILMVISWACLLWHWSAQIYLLLKKGLWYLQCLLAPAIVNWLGPQQEHQTSLSLSTVAAGEKHVGVSILQ